MTKMNERTPKIWAPCVLSIMLLFILALVIMPQEASSQQTVSPMEMRGMDLITNTVYLPVILHHHVKIVYTTERDGNSEIYKMNMDGSNQERLTNDNEYDSSPAWSPKGEKIVFSSNRTGNFELYIMNADGTGVEQITNLEGADVEPAWSPDGSKIVFTSILTGSIDLYVMDVDGTNQEWLTIEGGAFAAWSPDSQQIVFNCEQYLFSICKVNVDGTGKELVLWGNRYSMYWYPRWSPDGEKIGFVNNGDFCSVKVDGTEMNCTSIDGVEIYEGYVWSPDGSLILFSADGYIYIANANGTNLKQITNTGYDGEPEWVW